MAKFVSTVYINPPHSYMRWRKMRSHNLKDIGDGTMTVLTPVLPTTFRFVPRSIRRKLIAILAIPQTLQQLKPFLSPPIVLWSYLSELTLPLHRALKPNLLCYHRLDDYSMLIPQDRPLEVAIEARADLLFVVSSVLQQQYACQGREAILLPNGADIAHFSQALSDMVKVPDDLKSIPSPRIGFIGTVDPLWVDTDLLVKLANSRSDWSVVIIGPKRNWQPIKALPPNLHLLGMRPYEIIPHYLKGLDVCLIPFKNNAISRAASPLKFYEYLAAGRVIVSTLMPDLTLSPPIIWYASNPNDFIMAVSEALHFAHDPIRQQRCLTIAASHSWEQRAEIALAAIRETLKEGVL
ncbi:MAG: glycosyltransferase [Archaeoglobaceae archaeon]